MLFIDIRGGVMDYNNILISVVIPLVEQFGTIRQIEKIDSATWTKKFDSVLGIYYWEDESTGRIVYEEPNNSTQLIDVKSVQDNLSQEDMANSLVLATDSKYYIAPTGVEPKVGDVFIDNGIKYNIYLVQVLKPANLTMLYTIYCRVI